MEGQYDLVPVKEETDETTAEGHCVTQDAQDVETNDAPPLKQENDSSIHHGDGKNNCINTDRVAPEVKESPFQNIHIEALPEETVQQEISDYPKLENISNNLANSSALEYLRIEIKREYDPDYEHVSPVVNEKKDGTSTGHEVTVKQEIQMDENVSYDIPNFDNTSLHSDEGLGAIQNVEACLDEELPVKCENDTEIQILINVKEELALPDIKLEFGLTVTDTLLIPTCSSTVPEGQPPYKPLVIKIENNENGIPGIVVNCNGIQEKLENGVDPYLAEGHDEAVNLDMDAFQLNSITGDVLTLEQQALGVQDPRPEHCHLCPKTFRTKPSLKQHLDIHERIVKNEQSRIRGITKAKVTKAKKRRLREQKMARDYSQYLNDRAKGPKSEGQKCYYCTCGKAYQRRSRMETCLRAHDLFQANVSTVPCTSCHKRFKGKQELEMHKKRMHKKKFPCKFCPTDYNTKTDLLKHLKIHHQFQVLEYKVILEKFEKKQHFNCFLCSKTFTEISILKVHVMMEHQSPYTCPHCKNIFPSIHDLVTHTEAYHPNIEGQVVLNFVEALSRLVQDWKCGDCKLQFYEADKLALHLAENHRLNANVDSGIQCEHCRRIFPSQKALTSHERVHDRPSEQTKELVNGIMCLECRKMCKDINGLTSHMRLHSPDRKFPCKYCDFRFANKQKRRAHAEVHTGDMKYVCFICEYRCSSESRLKFHKRTPRHFNMRHYLLTGQQLGQDSTAKVAESEKMNDKKRPSDGVVDEADSSKKRKEKETSNKEKTSSSSSEDEGNSDREEAVACDVCGEQFSSYRNMQHHKQDHPFIEILADGQDKAERIFFK